MMSVRIRRLLLWVALPALTLVLLYTVLGFYLVPRLVRSGIKDFVAKNYHREVSLGEVRFNPYTLRLDLNELTLPDSDGQPMLSFRHLLVDLTVASIWHLGPDFQAIVLDDPFARVLIRADGSLNLSELAPPPSPNEKPEQNPKPVRLFINRLSVHGGNVAFEDRAHPSEFKTEIKPISFELRNFSTVTRDGGTYALTGASEDGERFSWSGSLTSAPLSSRGHFEIQNLLAKTIWEYLRDSLRFELPSGAISVAGDYDFTGASTPIGLAVNVHQITVTDLGIRPRGVGEDYIKLTRLEVHETRADVAKHTVDVGKVQLDGGEVRVWMPGEHGAALNLLELVAPASSTSSAASTPGVPPASPATAATSTSGVVPTNPAPAAASASDGASPSAATDTSGGAGAGSAAQTSAGATPPHVAAPPEGATWVVSVPDIGLDNFKITGEDRHLSPGVAMRLTDLRLHVGGFTTARNTPVAVTLSTKINSSSELDVKADLSPDMTAVKAHTELANLDLTLFQPYITRETDMTLRNGLLSTKLNAERSGDGRVSVTGEVEVAKLRTIDNELKRDFIKLDLLQISGLDYQANLSDTSKPAKLHVHNVTAKAPYARVIIEPDQTTNVGRVLRIPSKPQGSAQLKGSGTQNSGTNAHAGGTDSQGSGTNAQAGGTDSQGSSASAQASDQGPTADSGASANGKRHGKRQRRSEGKTATASEPAANTGMAIAVDTINFQDGSANYADLWIQPHFSLGIQMLNGSIRGLSSDPAARAKIDLKGKVDRYAPISISGETNPLAATRFSDIKMSFKGVEMSSVTPYSGRFAGYKIEKGKLSADIDYKIDNRSLTASHKFVIDQLELGERVDSPDAVKLPLKIAIALLKDRNGVIDLDLPVHGSLDDPQFDLGPVLWHAFVSILTKIATAPFAALAHLFGGSEQMSYIEFHPGSAVIDTSEHDKLTTLVKALKEKEKLELDVPVTVSPDIDRPALAAAHLNQRLLLEKQEQNSGGKRKKDSGDAPLPQSAVMDEPPPSDPALTDPAQRFALLAALYRTELGKGTPLPDSANAVVAAGKKKGAQPDFTAANAELEAALLQKHPIADTELEALGKHRARAIQQVLLVGTDIDPSRVFIIGTAPKPSTEKDTVRVDLALK